MVSSSRIKNCIVYFANVVGKIKKMFSISLNFAVSMDSGNASIVFVCLIFPFYLPYIKPGTFLHNRNLFPLLEYICIVFSFLVS